MPKDYLSMGITIVFATCSVSHLSDSDFTLTKVHEGNAKINKPTTTAEIAWMITGARTQKKTQQKQKKNINMQTISHSFHPTSIVNCQSENVEST